MMSGVGASRFTSLQAMPSPAITSAAHFAASTDRNRRSYPMTNPFPCVPSSFIFRASAAVSSCTFAFVNSSPITARQPPVPNPIMCFPSPSLPVCVRGYSVTSTSTVAPAGCTGTGPRISLPSTVRRRTPFCRPSGLCTAMR